MEFANGLLLAQEGDAGQAAAGAVGIIILLIELALVVAAFAGIWKCFVKAGKPGWAAIVPIYNIIVMLEIVGKPLWWVILFFIPCVNFVVLLLVMIDFAKAFGKSAAYGIGLWIAGFIFFPMLGFSDARYIGPPKS